MLEIARHFGIALQFGHCYNTEICIEIPYGETNLMKTTLDLNESLLTEAKAMAARQRTTLTRLIEEGLQLRLRKTPTRARHVQLPVYKGKGGLVPGLDPLSNKALRDAADRDS